MKIMNMPRRRIPDLRLAMLAGCALAMAGCDYLLPEGIEIGQHRITVQQGNVPNEEAIRNLRLGMEEEKVLFLLGTPLVKDPFNPNRWDYVFYQEASSAEDMSHLDRISLHFEDKRLVRVTRLVPLDPDLAVAEPSGELELREEWFEGTEAGDEAGSKADDAYEPVGEPEPVPLE